MKFSVYRRHHADVRATIVEVLSEAAADFGDKRMTIAITGSGGLLLAQWLGIEFVQEVIASKTAVETFIPATDVAIELGGEDAKIIYFDNGIEQRMNGTCAGGTGAFIDQMAALLNTDAGGLNELAQDAHAPSTPSPAAAACSPRPTCSPSSTRVRARRTSPHPSSSPWSRRPSRGLACGRPIRGHVAFLGGPLQYLPELRKRFYETLNLDDEHIIVPDNAHLFVAGGCAIAGAASETVKAELLDDVLDRLKNLGDIQGSEVVRLPPLFASEDEYAQFKSRHDGECVRARQPHGLRGHGLPRHRRRLHHVQGARSSARTARFCGRYYANNKGDVLGCARTALANLYNEMPVDADTGEPLVTHRSRHGDRLRRATCCWRRCAWTPARSRRWRICAAPQEMLPGVEFILDIGGQDMKCLRVKDGVIDHIMLNEACSFGLRQLHRELRHRPEPGRGRVRARRPCAPSTRSTWAAAAPCS